jgi:hypothetical protein
MATPTTGNKMKATVVGEKNVDLVDATLVCDSEGITLCCSHEQLAKITPEVEGYRLVQETTSRVTVILLWPQLRGAHLSVSQQGMEGKESINFVWKL